MIACNSYLNINDYWSVKQVEFCWIVPKLMISVVLLWGTNILLIDESMNSCWIQEEVVPKRHRVIAFLHGIVFDFVWRTFTPYPNLFMFIYLFHSSQYLFKETCDVFIYLLICIKWLLKQSNKFSFNRSKQRTKMF